MHREWSQRQPSVAKEREAQFGVAADAAQALVGAGRRFDLGGRLLRPHPQHAHALALRRPAPDAIDDAVGQGVSEAL